MGIVDAFLTALDEEELDEIDSKGVRRALLGIKKPRPNEDRQKRLRRALVGDSHLKSWTSHVKPPKETKLSNESVQVFADFDEWRSAVRVARGGDVEFRRVLTNGQLGDTRAFLDGKMLSESWDGERGTLFETSAADTLPVHYRGRESDEPEMALKHQPRVFRRTLKDILQSGFTPGSAGDRAFSALHRVERWDDANGNDDAVFNGSNIKQSSRSPRYGYKAGEDARHYDNLGENPILESAAAAAPSRRMRTSNTPWAIQVLPGLRPRS